MSVGGLFISALIVAVVAVWVFMPLIRPNKATNTPDTAAHIAGQRERLSILYERVLRNIRDLDEDFELGKLDPDEYTRERETFVQRGIAALQGLERLDNSQTIIEDSEADAALDEQLEDFIRQSTAALMMQREQQRLTQPTLQE